MLFQDFGGSSLDFELRGFLRDVEEIFRVASDLRFAIDKAFREAGIEIPFLQTDIHLRDMDRLEPPSPPRPTSSRRHILAEHRPPSLIKRKQYIFSTHAAHI